MTQGEQPNPEETQTAGAPEALTFASGRYVATRLLGEGGQKRVYLGRDTQLHRDIAIAFIKAEGLDEAALDRVRREAQTIAGLGAQPNVITIFDIGEEEGRPYTVCEYAPGGDLRQELRKADGPLPIERALAIGQDLCRGLALAHAHGILHRDVKPQNVLFAADGSAKLGDFGLAVAFGQSRMTAPGTVLGTAAYMPPEQALGSEVDARGDLYSLGCVLYEMVAGRPPFPGGDAIAMVSQHINSAPEAPSEHNPDVPRSLDALIIQLLAKAPHQRPESAVAVLESLSAIASAPAASGPIRAPAGTVTLLFTDVVASTALRERLGDDEAEAQRRAHFQLVREALTEEGGEEVKTLGDGFMVAFASALNALNCAIAIQRTVAADGQSEDEGQQLLVRVGVHAGEPTHEEGDYFGTPVVVAHRLCERARGGQIVVSELVRRLVGSRGGFAFRDLGAFTLKGIAEPVAACEVVWQRAEERRRERAGGLPLPPRLAVAERPAFLGRDEELEVLRGAWARALAGERQLVLLAGEPGIGKTRLAAEFALGAHAEGAAVLFGRCEEQEAIPCQPFAEAVRHWVDVCGPSAALDQAGAGAAGLVALLPELAERLPSAAAAAATPEAQRLGALRTIQSILASIAGTQPLLLLLDDLHWADSSTLLLLKHLVRAPLPRRCLILGTYRGTELGPGHPLGDTLADLRRDCPYLRLSLVGLNEASTGALAAARAGERCSSELARTIYEQTEGNPFFIEEVVRHLLETGAVQEREGELRSDPAVAQLRIPEGVKEVIGRRVSRLSRDCNSVLTIASVIGREFGLDSLQRASDLSTDRLLTSLEEAVHAGVVSEVPHLAGRYSFSHALIYEALYGELTRTRRVHLHGQTLQYADSQGVKLAYEVLGASGPYIIVSGISNCPAVRTRSGATARHWDRISRAARVILYDRRGVGFSAAPERGYSLLASVEDVRAVLDAVAVERAVLYGAVDGGPLALAFAAHHPERVAGLLLLGTSAKFTSSDDFALGVSAAVVESFQRMDPVDRSRAIAELTGTRPASVGADAISDALKSVPPRVWSKIVAGMGAADARSLLSRVRCPTLIMHDPGNTYIPVEAASYLHEQLAGSSIEITQDYGNPDWGEVLYGKIDAFIEDVTRGGS